MSLQSLEDPRIDDGYGARCGKPGKDKGGLGPAIGQQHDKDALRQPGPKTVHAPIDDTQDLFIRVGQCGSPGSIQNSRNRLTYPDQPQL